MSNTNQHDINALVGKIKVKAELIKIHFNNSHIANSQINKIRYILDELEEQINLGDNKDAT